MARSDFGLRFRRFEVSGRYNCNACGAPGDRFMFHWASRWFTGEVWCAECWHRAHAILTEAGLCGPVRAPAEQVVLEAR